MSLCRFLFIESDESSHRNGLSVRVGAVLLAFTALVAVACNGEHRPKAAVNDDDHELPDPVKLDPCATPAEGCPCDDEGETSKCGAIKEVRGDHAICREGVRLCVDNTWGDCVIAQEVRKPLSFKAKVPGRGLKALGGSSSCNDLCDPECQTLADTPDGLTVPSDLLADEEGLTLPGGSSGGSCNNLSVSPTTSTITITAIASNGTITASPVSVDLGATCGGLPAQPSWSLNHFDRAVVDADGIVRVFAGTAGAISVTAETSTGSAVATVNVKVALGSTLDAAGNTNETGRTLYPYKNTVFPLDLQVPLTQYETGGTAATRVQMALRYPTGSASPTFLHVETFSGTNIDPKQGTLNTNVPAWKPSQAVWNAFGRTVSAGGGTGEILIRRRNGSTQYKEMSIPVKFADSPLRGTVYYTQYMRRLATSTANATSTLCAANASSGEPVQTGCNFNAGSYSPGQICPVGTRTHPQGAGTKSATRAIDMSTSTATNLDPYNGTSNNGCPVCHSVSANGLVHVAGSQNWQLPSTAMGVNQITTTSTGSPRFQTYGTGRAPTYSGIADNITPASPDWNCSNDGVNKVAGSDGNNYQNCERIGEFSRGYSYSAISPDGAWVLQAPAFWGNTLETPAASTTQDGTMKGLTGSTKPYFFSKTQAPSIGVQAATTANLAASRSSNVLSSSANATLGNIDNVPMALGRAVLVKNQTTKADNGVYVVTNMGSGSTKWQLTRRYDADSSSEMASGTEIRVTDGNTNRGKTFYVSNASVTLNTTGLDILDRARPTNMPSMMTPVFSPDGTKVAYINADADTSSGLAASGWRRGLSMFSFNQASVSISTFKRLLNTYGGTNVPMKWPFFESDSRSLLFVETESGEFCSSTDNANATDANSDIRRACYQGAYGSMSPTTRGYWKGVITSIDTAAATPSTTKTALANLNKADDVTGGDNAGWNDRAYQPTVLPFSTGGYRWVIFTSPRNYGNQLNSRYASNGSEIGNTHFTCAAPMLWMAAITDSTASTTDRSNPAFLVPGQNMSTITSDHYINERGYLVPSPCKPVDSSCTASDECCGYDDEETPTVCRAEHGWTAADGTPTRSCQTMSGTCAIEGESCDTDADCCGDYGSCVNFECAAQPAFEAATFTRDYVAECPTAYHPKWSLFSFHLTTEGDSSLGFSVKTASGVAGLDSATEVVLGTSTADAVSPAAAQYYDVRAKLETAGISSHYSHLRLIVDLNPSTDGLSAPVLHDWEMEYTCEVGE